MAKKDIVLKNKNDQQLHNFIKTLNKSKLSKTNCKLCNSKFKNVAEEHYESKKQNLLSVKKFVDEKGENISYRGIRNHFKRHYIGVSDLEALHEYGEELAVWSERRFDIRQNMQDRINILTKEMVVIA